MLRILRAFAWMRWRVFVNSLEHTGSRDALQRVAIAIERLAPLMVAAVMIPSAVVLAGLAGLAGYQLPSETRSFGAFAAIRVLLFIATAFAVIAPAVMPGADRTNPVRLLLLPIPARTLYVAQAGGAISDPWIVLVFPVVLALPIGLLMSGATGAALAALAGGFVLIVILIGLSALMTTVVHLVLRDRRRGEIVALFFILILPLIGFFPAMLASDERRELRRQTEAANEQAPPPERRRIVVRLGSWSRRVSQAMPSELYSAAVRTAAREGTPTALWPMAGLAASVLIIHAIGLALFLRVLSSPGATGSRRVASARGDRVWGRQLPGVAPGTSAVAFSLLRLVLRTPRGRSILLAPLIMFAFFGFFVFQTGSFDLGPIKTGSGLGLAAFLSGMSLISILPIAMNQFAVDGAGLTLMLLSPLTTRQLLVGKALGGALVAIPTALVCALICAVVFPGGHPGVWMALVISLVAIYVTSAPVSAMLSAAFPRKVDMNSIGRGSNAHGLAGFAGLLLFVAAGAPCVALTLVAAAVLGQPWLAPVLTLAWTAVACGIARLLFVPAERLFEQRRESLALLI